MSSVVGSEAAGADKMTRESAKQGMGSRAASKVTFHEGDNKHQVHSASHPPDGQNRLSNYSAPGAHPVPLSGLRRKDDINPFKFASDVDFCALSQMDKREKNQEREQMKNLRVHEKLSKSQKLMQGRRFRVLKEIDEEINHEKALDKENRVASMRDNAPWLVAITRNRRVENESLHDFIEKKRNMFVLQYELTVKRTEMRKLEEITTAEEQRIEKAEKDLEEDANMFEQFLKANNKNADEAARLADEEARKKLEKVAEIKRLHGQITALKSELVRREDELNELKQYKQFLDQITPIEWKEERRRKLELERLARQKTEVQSTTTSDEQASKTGSRSQNRLAETKLTKRVGVAGTKATQNTVANRRPSMASNNETDPNLKNPSETDLLRSTSDSNTIDLSNDFELYFTDPHQLLAIFTELEEQNLSLIQNSQDHEEQLEEITRELNQTMEKKNAETESLKRQVAVLEQAIAVEEQKERELMAKVDAHSLFNDEAKQEEYTKKLEAVIKDVYRKIFNEGPVATELLKILATIENRLEEVFQDIDSMDPQRLQEAEKAKEKERRIKLRKEKKEEEERAIEEKKRKAALRAKEPPRKHLGRPIAERSRPPESKKTDKDNISKTNQEEEELAYYFT